jgi:hypothetical protein
MPIFVGGGFVGTIIAIVVIEHKYQRATEPEKKRRLNEKIVRLSSVLVTIVTSTRLSRWKWLRVNTRLLNHNIAKREKSLNPRN